MRSGSSSRWDGVQSTSTEPGPRRAAANRTRTQRSEFLPAGFQGRPPFQPSTTGLQSHTYTMGPLECSKAKHNASNSALGTVCTAPERGAARPLLGSQASAGGKSSEVQERSRQTTAAPHRRLRRSDVYFPPRAAPKKVERVAPFGRREVTQRLAAERDGVRESRALNKPRHRQGRRRDPSKPEGRVSISPRKGGGD